MNALPVSHPHYPFTSHHILASLVKGRWIDGKAQTVASLRFTCDTSAFLFAKLFCRQDGGIALHHQPFPNRTIPRLAPSPLPFNERSASFAKCSKPPTPLPPLEKGEVARWGLFLIRTINEIFRTIPLAFRNVSVYVCLYGFTFALSRSLFVGERACSSRCTECCHPHNHCKKTTIPRLALNLPPLSKVRCCRPKKIRATTGGIVTPPTHPKPHYPLASHQHPCLLMNALFVLRHCLVSH